MKYTVILHRAERLQDPGAKDFLPSVQDVFVARIDIPGSMQHPWEAVHKAAIQMALEQDGENPQPWLEPTDPPREDDYIVILMLHGHPELLLGWQYAFNMF